MLSYSTTTLKDVVWMGKHLRAADRRELETASGLVPMRALARAVALSTFACTVRLPDTDDPLYLFGVAPSKTSGRGVIWMAGTDAISASRHRIAKDAPRILHILSQPYVNGLHCLVDARNTLHVRWLKRFGFTPNGQQTLNGYTFLEMDYSLV